MERNLRLPTTSVLVGISRLAICLCLQLHCWLRRKRAHSSMAEQDSIESRMWVRIPLSPMNYLCAFVAEFERSHARRLLIGTDRTLSLRTADRKLITLFRLRGSIICPTKRAWRALPSRLGCTSLYSRTRRCPFTQRVSNLGRSEHYSI